MYRTIASLLGAALLLSGCGKNNSFQSTDEPEFAVEVGFVKLMMPPSDDRTQSQNALVLRNTGDGELEVTKLEFIDVPERLVALGERHGSCAEGCAADQICMTASQVCTETGLPEPFTLGPQLREDIELAILAGPSELDCPEPTIEVPAEYINGYCGAIRIETNAINNGEFVEEGAATIYFVTDGASGEIVAEPTFLEFANVQPGSVHTQTLSLRNEGTNDLELYTMNVEDNPDYFAFTGQTVNVPGTIASGESAEFDVTVSIPEGATDYETTTTLVIDSSGGVARIAVKVTSDTGATPFIEPSAEVLKFDSSATQTLTLTNTGETTLAVNGVSVDPTARPFYTFEVDGTDVTGSFQPVNVPAGESMDLVIHFARPAGNEDPSVGLLKIAHNDPNHGFSTEITLLGDEGDLPIGRVHPSAFTFLAEDGSNGVRTFVIRNIGTAALDLTGIEWGDFSQTGGSNAEFQVDISGSIPPGGLKAGTVTFMGMNVTPDSGPVLFQSNNLTQLQLLLRALPSTQTQPNPVITVQNQGTLRTSAPVELSAATSTPADSLGNAVWTLVARPDGSAVFLDGVGEEASFVPDVAGTYTVALTLLVSDREAQTTLDLTVE